MTRRLVRSSFSRSYRVSILVISIIWRILLLSIVVERVVLPADRGHCSCGEWSSLHFFESRSNKVAHLVCVSAPKLGQQQEPC